MIPEHDLFHIRFLEIGCGEGIYSKYLTSKGATGVAIDFSDRAIEVAEKNVSEATNKGKLTVKKMNFMTDDLSSLGKFDIVFSVMVLEHVEDQISFLKKISEVLKTEGRGVLIVPARPECWGIEDDSAGHLRRYTRESLALVLNEAKFEVERMNSIGVPVVNFLLNISNFLVGRSENHKQNLSQEMKTKLSGSREIPFKTVFPSFFKLFLNEFTMLPLKLFQRLFYRTGKGLILGATFKKAGGL